eukprot:15055737-Alexandrium_andersonii.AAC.1
MADISGDEGAEEPPKGYRTVDLSDGSHRAAERLPDSVHLLCPEWRSDSGGVPETLYHLVQDEKLIQRIHEEELPPDEYYIELRT